MFILNVNKLIYKEFQDSDRPSHPSYLFASMDVKYVLNYNQERRSWKL